LIDVRGLDRFIAFDPEQGLLSCESGITLEAILRLVVPHGWFLPVTPGTRYVTVGGAIANDVHGKNHHRAGSFGNHVLRFELLRSSGERHVCSDAENRDWFEATIGGLGMTGVITWAELKLRRITSTLLDVETRRFHGIEEFLELSATADKKFEYTVAWFDCVARGDEFGRGIFMGGNHAAESKLGRHFGKSSGIQVPFTMPFSVINKVTLRSFNALYYHWPRARRRQIHFVPFFYPLDGVSQWNRLYGPKGFLQYQCVVPLPIAATALRNILQEITRKGSGSPLAVLKVFGAVPSKGWLSFPREGVTLALDFPVGSRVLRLLERLDQLVTDAGGVVYPAKDARLSATAFQAFYPSWSRLETYRDPAIMSGFWRRVTGDRSTLKTAENV
jgi:FAD/FMN-containing dehydrogenase